MHWTESTTDDVSFDVGILSMGEGHDQYVSGECSYSRCDVLNVRVGAFRWEPFCVRRVPLTAALQRCLAHDQSGTFDDDVSTYQHTTDSGGR